MPLAHLAANRLPGGVLGSYSAGFVDAAIALFRRAREGRGLVDFTFYPAAYCLRHGIELFVKQLSEYVAYEVRDPKVLYQPGHDLDAAWSRITEMVEWNAHEPGATGEDLSHHLDVINSVIEELHELDPRGSLFRYPECVQRARPDRPPSRQDTHVPFDDVNLEDWEATAEAVLDAVQTLLYEWGERASFLRDRRGDPPTHYSDLIPSSPPEPGRGESG